MFESYNYEVIWALESEVCTMIEVKNISMQFGNQQILNDISFYIKKGTKFAIIGDSGCGKSTLARIIMNLVSPTKGDVFINGRKIKHYVRKEKAKKIQMVFQHPVSSFNPRIKLRKQIEEPLKINNLSADIEKYLLNFGLKSCILERYPFQISGGEAQRLSIIRFLITNPDILILDEPTSMLDVSTQAEVFNYLQEYQEKNQITFILISHDIELVSQVCDYIVVINEGKIIEMDYVKNILSEPKCAYTKKMIENFEFFY